MSWLPRSLTTSLTLDDDDTYHDNDNNSSSTTCNDGTGFTRESDVVSNDNNSSSMRDTEGSEMNDVEQLQCRGVKEDLTELKQTLRRQFWGVASFLAPPPSSASGDDLVVPDLDQAEPAGPSEGEAWDSEGIGERFRSGMVSEISRMASGYFPFGSDENGGESREENEGESREGIEENDDGSDDDDWDEEAIGVTDEVLAFARNIAMHPETWLDFPLDEEEDLDDFIMSDAQRKHALAIERFVRRLAALRVELCPCHMTESYFWKVYFVLLHSRLNKHDTEILSTPQVAEARAMWMQELHKQTKPESDWFGSSTLHAGNSPKVLHDDFECAKTFDFEPTTSTASDYETEKHAVPSLDMPFIDKSVIEEKPVIKLEDNDQRIGLSPKILLQDYEDDDDDWPDEEDLDLGDYKTTISVGNTEAISFSDLEDDASIIIPLKSTTNSKGK